jgi:hypothetical protein
MTSSDISPPRKLLGLKSDSRFNIYLKHQYIIIVSNN